MARIKVHLLNFHSLFFTHIELVLENLSAYPSTFYSINQASPPARKFSYAHINRINVASSRYAFEIEANPDDIVRKWREHYYQMDCSFPLWNNCADITQWFLKTFANIPNPSIFSSTPIRFNYFAFGIFVPRFMPVGVSLPGRVMDNAKQHIEARSNQPQSSSTGLFSHRKAVYLTALATTVVSSYVVATKSFTR